MSSSSTTEYTAAYLAETRVPEYLAGCIAPTAVATVFVCARIYSRAVILRVWGHDDTLITISWLGSVSVTVLDSLLVQYGAGRHIQTLTASDAKPLNVLAYVVRLIYLLVLSTTKLSVCCFYLRVFTDRRSRFFSYGLMGFIVLFTIPLILVQIFQCKPLSDAWATSNANCPVNEITVVNVTGIFNILGDAMLLGFVVPRILSLQMALKQKIALMAIVTTSLLVIIAAIIRTRLVSQLADSSDASWDNVVIGLWSVVEINTGIFCAAITAIKPLLRQVFPSLLSSHDHSSYGRRATTAYGMGTKPRTGTGPPGFELHSMHEDQNFDSQLATTNKFWAGKRDKSTGDDNSETHVLGDGNIDVTKTVDITISRARDTFLDKDSNSGSSVKRYEHV